MSAQIEELIDCIATLTERAEMLIDAVERLTEVMLATTGEQDVEDEGCYLDGSKI